jgi:prenyltransferase beta subunit
MKMSDIQIDQEFFSAARRGLKKLSNEERELLKVAVEKSIQPKGCFGADEESADLYTTSFGIQLATLLGIDQKTNAITKYLRSFQDAIGLHYVHVVSLARCWRFYSHDSLDIGSYSKIAEKIEYNRCSDGSWNQANGTHFSSVYGTFLALAGYQDLDQSVPDEVKIVEAMKGLRSSDGAFGTDQGAHNGTTPSTAFAAIILNYMEENTDFCISWLLKQQHSDGGFLAVSKMPFGDMQSTVYALMAIYFAAPDKLKEVGPDVEKFVLSLKRDGGFLGHCKEEAPGLENTFLALCALGISG